MNKKVILRENDYKTQIAGYINESAIRQLDISYLVELKTEVYIFPGTIKHIKKRHYKGYKKYFKNIPEIIRNPDYIGISQTKNIRIEVVKKYKEYVLIGIKINNKGQFFICSLYIMDEDRVKKRIQYGRLKRIGSFKDYTNKPYKNKYPNNNRTKGK